MNDTNPPPTPVVHKICSKCSQLLESDCFYAHKNGKHGLNSYCKLCAKYMIARKRALVRARKLLEKKARIAGEEALLATLPEPFWPPKR